MKKESKIMNNDLFFENSKETIKKVLIGGISVIAGTAILSSMIYVREEDRPVYTTTAIIMENGNPTIVDLESYEPKDRTFTSVDSWILHTVDGEEIIVDSEDITIITSQNSHELALSRLEEMTNEDGKNISNKKNTFKTLKLGL